MAEVPRLQHVPEALVTFQGVNLRRDRLALRDEDCARAINFDLHTQVGTALLRRGRTLLTSLAGGAVRTLATIGPSRYVIGGQVLYKDGVSLVSSLHSALLTTLAHQRPLNDPDTWVFIGDRAGMQKETGGTVRTWGIAAPTATPSLAAGAASSLSGVYTVSYTYVRKNGSAQCHESNPSPTSSPITVTSTNIAVTGLTDSSDAQVTHKRLYRTVNGGSTRLFDQEIAQGVTTATLSQADTALGTAVETDNDVPPVAPWIVRHLEHMFFLDPAYPHYLKWSKRFRPESVPATNFIEIGSAADPLNGAVSLVGLLGVFTAKTKYRVLGNATSGFTALEALSSRGTPAPQAALVTEKGCLFVARDGLFRTTFTQEDEELSTLIAPLFEGLTVNDYAPINWDAAHTMALAYYKQRLYFSYPSGDHTQPDMLAVYSWHTNHWYFYQYDVPMRALYFEESTDYLLGGGADGSLSRLEAGRSDHGAAITAELETATRALGEAFLLKRFDFWRPDAQGAVTAALYLDDQLDATTSIMGERLRRLKRLRGTEAKTWRARFTYSGTDSITVDGVQVLAVPLGRT